MSSDPADPEYVLEPRTTQVETDRSRNAFASAKAATDPMLEALAAAPLDDEPTTDEEDRSAW